MVDLQSGSFESLVSRPDSHVVVDLSPDSSVLLILFGGIAGGVSMPVFEFFRVSSDLPVKKAFLRDPRRGWYQLGIPGVGDTAESVRDLLDGLIAHAAVERVVMAGASAGGFAALHFGTLCRADEVVAFSPQTFVDEDNRQATGDSRWQPQIDVLHASLGARARALDVLHLLPPSAGKTRCQLHVSSDDPLDLVHARRLAEMGGVEIIEHESGGHRLVKTLRDRDLLGPILKQALTGGDGHAISARQSPD